MQTKSAMPNYRGFGKRPTSPAERGGIIPSRREQFCAKSFTRFLCDDAESPLPCWKLGEDPPDFYLFLGEDAFAVEVTSTQVLRQPKLGAEPIIEETFRHSHSRIAHDLERMSDARGFSGRYILSFDQPIASRRYSIVRKDLLDELVNAVGRSQNSSETSSQDILLDNTLLCWLFRGGEGRMKVHVATGDDASTESPEFRAFVGEILQRAIAQKKSKLEAKAISHPLILLLLNTYSFAVRSDYMSALDSIPERHAFHSIFLVAGDGAGQMLQSRRKKWMPLVNNATQANNSLERTGDAAAEASSN